MSKTFHPNVLTQIIVTLLASVGCQSVFADDSSTATASSWTNNAQAQQFYKKYFIKNTSAESSSDTTNHKTRLCSGAWVLPIAADTPTEKHPADAETAIYADNAYYNPDNIAELTGDVQIEQQGRQIHAEQVIYHQNNQDIEAKGNITLAQNGVVIQSQTAKYNLNSQVGEFNDNYYAGEQQNAHGYAQKISRQSPTVMTLNHATYSTCAPSKHPEWYIQAQKITLNQDTGRGVSRNAKLYIKDIPVLPVPYFNFPIDDRRATGLLTPTFGYTNDGGLQLSVPYYFNLAPHYDLTATPSYLTDRGVMTAGQFRYLTEKFGQGEIYGSYLPKDDRYGGKDRKDLHWQHLWKITPQWQTAFDYNYVSDKDFFSDLKNDSAVDNILNQPRTWTLDYGNGIRGLQAQLKVQNFQTLDPSIQDANKPYARLPQLNISYQGGDFSGFSYQWIHDSAYFKKSIDDGSVDEDSGVRIYNSAGVAYNFRTPGVFITPQVTVRSLNYFYDEDSQLSHSDKKSSVIIPQVTLDAGLIFEKQGKYLQTLTPRLFYAYAPYKNQSANPNYDSAGASIGYDQLFTPYRFYGHDRLEDNHFVSLGINYSLYDQQGLARLRGAVGNSFYFADRQVRLSEKDPIAHSKTSGPVVTLSSQLSNHINVVANAAWLPDGHESLRNIAVNYADERGRLYNVGYYYRNNISSINQQAYNQITASFVQPINEKWRILGSAQYDFRINTMRDWLVGMNYQSCCWGVSVYARSYYNDLDDPTLPNVKAKHAVMAEFTLKGLGGLSGKLDALLQNRVTGFNYVNQTWMQP